MKINIGNTEKIERALHTVQARCTVNTLEPADLISLCAQAEHSLNAMGIPQARMAGAAIGYCPAGPTAASYKYPQGATGVSLIRGNSTWFLNHVAREDVYPKEEEYRRLSLTPEQEAEAIEKYRGSLNSF